MTVHLIGVGRNRVNEDFPFKSWDDLYQRVCSHLKSSDVSLTWNRNETEAHVIVGGLRGVGTVLLTEDLPPGQ